MKAIQENSRFDLYVDMVPEKISDRTLHFLLWLRDTLISADLVLSDVAAYTPSSWAWDINSLDLIVFATFESRIELIDELSEIIAPIYEELLVLPVLIPVQVGDWFAHVESETRLYRHISRKCIYVYSGELQA